MSRTSRCIGALAFSTTLAVLTTGCPGAACPVRPHTDPLTALRYFESMRARVSSVKAEARVDTRGRQGRVRGTVWMFVERPNRVRFDAMTQLGPAAILTSDGERFALTDLRERRYLQGPTCPENIARLLGVSMSGEDLTRFLLGGTPVIEGEQQSLRCEDGVYHIVISGTDGRRQEIDLAVREHDVETQAPPEEQRLRLMRSELFDAEGATEWRTTYDDYRVIPAGAMGVAVPFWVRFEDVRRDADTVVRFESVDLNAEVPAEAFAQTPAGGLSVEEVSCEPTSE